MKKLDKVPQASKYVKTSLTRTSLPETLAPTNLLYYDPYAEVEAKQRNLPHWQQEGTAYFVTFRLYDSIPKEVSDQITIEREQWLKS